MIFPFRQHHILSILEGYDKQSLPLDLFLKDYFRLHKALGSKDRAYVADTTCALVRWKGLLDFLCGENPDWQQRLNIFFDPSFEKSKQNKNLPDNVRLSFPKPLFDCLVSSHGFQKACEICEISNEPAPTTVRINALKTTRDEMLARWKGIYEIQPCTYSENGIIFKKRMNFSSMPEFQEGLFEVQDEGSQLLAELVKAKPGDLVMDYCAGSGGKTLAFAPKMQNKGQIYLHDIREYILQEARKRLRKAGIQNAQIIHYDDQKLKKLKKNMDWVLVDVPCSGTGTLRRNPDMKWKFEPSKIPQIQGQQRMIFEKALSFMKPTGFIVYSTCSLLNEENHAQINHFMKTYHLSLAENIFESLPKRQGMDGFFGAVLKRSS